MTPKIAGPSAHQKGHDIVTVSEPQPLLLASALGQGQASQTFSLFLGPVGLPFCAGLILWGMLRSSWPAADLFPLFVALQLLLYLGAGFPWSFGAALVASLVGLMGFFFSTAPQARFLYPAHIGLVWAVLYLLAMFDRKRQSAWNRFHEQWDGLEMDLSHMQADVENARSNIADSRARIVAFDRLQLFTDDLIGPYHREELLAKAQNGLATMFPRSKVTVHLFPKPDAPAAEDELGMKVLQWGQPRLLPNKAMATPTWEEGHAIVLPLKGRENFLGFILLDMKNDGVFGMHELRLASISADLISLALGNTERFSQTEALAISDELTGIYTRGYFNERLQEEFAKARHKDRPFALALLDIDHFKKVNDMHGHHIGDEVLRWLARLVTGQARETDFVARYGGEEFVVLMPNTKGVDALRFTQRLCKAIAATPFRWGAKKIKITISAGVASLKEEITIEEELVRRADEALYSAKNGGRNRVVAYEG